MKVWFDFNKLHWSSDWNGDEVGYDDVDVVGLYIWSDEYDNEMEISFYIDMNTMEILEMWYSKE